MASIGTDSEGLASVCGNDLRTEIFQLRCSYSPLQVFVISLSVSERAGPAFWAVVWVRRHFSHQQKNL